MASRRPARLSAWLPGRRAPLVALLLAQLASGVGYVAPAARPGKDTSRPYPCMDRPCGCLTYEACWAGDCCCFTLREKIAWARENGIVPPAHAVRLAGRLDPPDPGCADGGQGDHCPVCRVMACPECDRSAPSAGGPAYRWVLGVAARRCQGDAPAGSGAVAPAVPPAAPTAWTFEWAPAGTVPVVPSGRPITRPGAESPPPRA